MSTHVFGGIGQKALKRLVILIAASMAVSAVSTQGSELIGIIKSDTINTGFGKRIMPLGDQNGDGYDDLMIFDVLGHGYFYCGRASADTITSYDLQFNGIAYRASSVGDVDGDNVDDFVALGTAASRRKLNLYLGGMGLDTIRDQWFGADSLYGVGYTAHADIDADGTQELVSFGSESNSALLYELGIPPDSIHELCLTPANLQWLVDYDNFGRSPVVGFFNGDREPDLALGLLRHLGSGVRGAVYFYWGGSTFDTIPDLIVDRPGGYVLGSEYFGTEVLEYAGDLNGDGFDDLFASSGSAIDDSLGFIFFGGPALDSIPEVVISIWHTVARCAGDVNHDGFADLITSHPLPFSGLGDVRVYYGGPAMDSIPDITFTAAGMPGYQVEFGLDCSGVGDFNGDGLNDFAFSYKNGYGYGIVLIYSGTDANSVDYGYEPTLPSDITLQQNYPNPFNQATMIEFTLPRRCRMELTIYDVLGRSVTNLIQGIHSAGTYRVTWDGRDALGRTSASGIYLCRLTADEVSITRKMILLK